MIGALREIPGFSDAVDETLDDSSFNFETRAAIVSALGRGIDEASEFPGSAFQSLATDLFHRYWMNHVNRVGGKDGTALATYLGWLDNSNCPLRKSPRLSRLHLIRPAARGKPETFWPTSSVTSMRTRTGHSGSCACAWPGGA